MDQPAVIFRQIFLLFDLHCLHRLLKDRKNSGTQKIRSVSPRLFLLRLLFLCLYLAVDFRRQDVQFPVCILYHLHTVTVCRIIFIDRRLQQLLHLIHARKVHRKIIDLHGIRLLHGLLPAVLHNRLHLRYNVFLPADLPEQDFSSLQRKLRLHKYKFIALFRYRIPCPRHTVFRFLRIRHLPYQRTV